PGGPGEISFGRVAVAQSVALGLPPEAATPAHITGPFFETLVWVDTDDQEQGFHLYATDELSSGGNPVVVTLPAQPGRGTFGSAGINRGTLSPGHQYKF